MNTTALRVVLDTNVLIASIGRRSPFRWLFDAAIIGRVRLCVSNEILFEYQEILASKTSSEVAENVINFITVSPHTLKVDIFFNFGLITSDPSDNKFVDCAIAANADCIVSNDKHFQVLRTTEFPQINIFTLREFEDNYRSGLSSQA